MGGTPKVKETPYEKALADVYAEQWKMYQDEIVPFENRAIEDATTSNDAKVYRDIGGDTQLGYQRAFSQAGQTRAEQLTAAGVDPSSGKFSSAMRSLSDMESSVTTDAKSRAQLDGQDRYLTKMSNIMAMGQGESQQAVASLNDIAVDAQRKAILDASLAQRRRNNAMGLLGEVSGAAARLAKEEPNTKSGG